MTRRFLAILVAVTAIMLVLTGCKSTGRNTENGEDSTDDFGSRIVKLDDAEVERRLESYFLDLDAAANLGEFYNLVSERLAVEIVVKAEGISPDTPIELKNSRESLVVQILEYVCAGTRTRFEVRKGKVWILDAK